MGRSSNRSRSRIGATRPSSVLGFVLVASCGDSPTAQPVGDIEAPERICTIDTRLIFNGAAKDAIPALTDPPLVSAGDAADGYLRDRFRVVGIRLGASYIAVPHNILWWHEIVNLNVAATQLAVTYCPLTGSAWSIDGLATEGPLLGSRLESVDQAFVAFWFAWAGFQPRTRIWTQSS